jgi:hypothetical protein
MVTRSRMDQGDRTSDHKPRAKSSPYDEDSDDSCNADDEAGGSSFGAGSEFSDVDIAQATHGAVRDRWVGLARFRQSVSSKRYSESSAGRSSSAALRVQLVPEPPRTPGLTEDSLNSLTDQAWTDEYGVLHEESVP